MNRALFLTLLCFSVASLSIHRCEAQQNLTHNPASSVAGKVLDKANATWKFPDIIQHLSRLGRVAILVESEPLRFTEKSHDVRDALTGKPSYHIAATKIASLLDYRIERIGSVSIWKKNYTFLDDFPCITISESYLFVQDLDALLKRFSQRWEVRQVPHR